MRLAVVATVLDEAESIRGLLDGLLGQTRAPDEILLSDGGSTDGTDAVILAYAERGAPVRLVRAPGANIARGRNLAIARAAAEIIACTDAGSRADPRWLEEIAAPLESGHADVACGVSRPDARTRTERSLAILLLPDPARVDARTFSPSSRSVAFRKRVWEAVGGYPEGLAWAEDTLFNLRLRRAGARFAFCPKAAVAWRPPSKLRDAARKLFRYGLGDGTARLRRAEYLRIEAKVLCALCLGLGGIRFPGAWVLLAALLGAYAARTVRLNRDRGSAADALLASLHGLFLDPVRLLGYLYGRFGGGGGSRPCLDAPAGGRGSPDG